MVMDLDQQKLHEQSLSAELVVYILVLIIHQAAFMNLFTAHA